MCRWQLCQIIFKGVSTYKVSYEFNILYICVKMFPSKSLLEIAHVITFQTPYWGNPWKTWRRGWKFRFQGLRSAVVYWLLQATVCGCDDLKSLTFVSRGCFWSASRIRERRPSGTKLSGVGVLGVKKMARELHVNNSACLKNWGRFSLVSKGRWRSYWLKLKPV